MEDEVILGEGLMMVIVKRQCFTEGLLASDELSSRLVEPLVGEEAVGVLW